MKVITAKFEAPEGNSAELVQILQMIHTYSGARRVTARVATVGAELAEVQMTDTEVILIFV
jgi:hypothetical protein